MSITRKLKAKIDGKAHKDLTSYVAGERDYRSDRYRTDSGMRAFLLAEFDWAVRLVWLLLPTAGANFAARDAGRMFLSARGPLTLADRVRLERATYRLLMWSRFATVFPFVFHGWLLTANLQTLGEHWGVYVFSSCLHLTIALVTLPNAHALRSQVTLAIRKSHALLHAEHPHLFAFAPKPSEAAGAQAAA